MMYTVSDIQRITQSYPNLCAFGFRDTFRADDLPLTDPTVIPQINAAGIFIRERCQQTAQIQRKDTSYGWKHVAESWLRESQMGGYVSNGAFIAAAALAGYRVERDAPQKPNAVFNMRSRPLARKLVPGEAAALGQVAPGPATTQADPRRKLCECQNGLRHY